MSFQMSSFQKSDLGRPKGGRHLAVVFALQADQMWRLIVAVYPVDLVGMSWG